jgi:anti-anti-sigma factor
MYRKWLEGYIKTRGEIPMEIKVTTEFGNVPVTVVHVDGNIDSSTYQAFQDKVTGLINDGAQDVLVDLSHTPLVSSAGLRAIHEIFNQLRAANNEIDDEAMRQGISAGTYKSKHLKLLNLSHATKVAFETAGFDMYIETFTDLSTAVASF